MFGYNTKLAGCMSKPPKNCPLGGPREGTYNPPIPETVSIDPLLSAMTPLERAASAVVTSKELFVESVLRDDSPILEGDPPKTIFSQPMIDDLVPGYLIRLRRTFVVLAFDALCRPPQHPWRPPTHLERQAL
jgi:hypothetical protein